MNTKIMVIVLCLSYASFGSVVALDCAPCICQPTWVDCSRRNLSNSQIPTNLPLTCTHVDLSFNRLLTVPSTILSKLKKLEWLDLSENNITRLTATSFQTLTSLKVLNMSHNHLSNDHDQNITPAFNELHSISNLILANNKLTTVPALNLTSLRSVSFASNAIKVSLEMPLFPSTWNATHKLTEVNLSGNPLNNVYSHSLSSLSDLSVSKIDFSSCNILNFDKAAVNSMAATLRVLIINNNMLGNKIGSITESNLKLTSLSAEKNSIARLTFSQSLRKSLKSLALSQNLFASISPAFCNLTKLKELDLSKNQIRDLTDQSFFCNMNLRGLQVLDLSEQQVNGYLKIYPKAFKGLTGLTSLALHSNRLDFKSPQTNLRDRLQFTPKLKVLDLSRNVISQFQQDSFWNSKKLQTLNASHNKIVRWHHDTFHPTPHLTSLDLSNNNIQVINAPDKNTSLNGISTSLHFFDASNNPFNCTCDILWFQTWIRQHGLGAEVSGYVCKHPDKWHNQLLIKFTDKACPAPTQAPTAAPTPAGRKSLPTWAVVCISVVGACILLGLTTTVACRYRRRERSEDEARVPFISAGPTEDGQNIPLAEISIARAFQRCIGRDSEYETIT